MRKFLFILLSVWSTAAAGAVPSQCVFENYTTLDGLSHNNIADIYVDSRGFVWTCTWYGANRFDGYEFKSFYADERTPSLSHSRFLDVTEDASGHLWFRTYDNHIYRFNRYTEQFEDVVSDGGLSDDGNYRVGTMSCDPAGNVWLELRGQGLVRVHSRADASPAEVQSFLGEEIIGSQIDHIVSDGRGAVWVVSQGREICRLVPSAEGAYEAEHVATAQDPVTAVAVTEESICFAAGDRLIKIRTADPGKIFVAAGLSTISALEYDRGRKVLYVGTIDGRVGTFTESSAKVEFSAADGDRPGRIRSMKADSRGLLWLVTVDRGVTRYDPARHNFRRFVQRNNVSEHYCDTTAYVTESHGTVWIKMNEVGFGWYDPENDSVEPFFNDERRDDFRMCNGMVRYCFDRDGVLWFSSYNERGLGKAVFRRRSFETLGGKPFSGQIRALMRDRRGNVWMGMRDGRLVCMDRERRAVRAIDRSTPGCGELDLIYALCEDSRGNVWIGTKGAGVFRLSPGGAVKRFRHVEGEAGSLSDDRIYSIVQDRDGRMWFASYGGGLNMLENCDSERFYNSTEGFDLYPSGRCGMVRSLMVDGDDRILAGTTEGLLVFDPRVAPENMRFSVFQRDVNDPQSLSANDIVHIFKDSDGGVWLSTFGGGVNRIESWGPKGEPRLRRYTASQGLADNIVFATAEDRHGDVWAMMPRSVSRLDRSKGIFTTYTVFDAGREQTFNEAAAVADSHGDIFLGSDSDLYVVDPDSLPQQNYDYRLRLTGLRMNNLDVEVGDDSPLGVSVAECGGIELPPRYLTFEVAFASLNHLIGGDLGYMYKLEGYDREWRVARNLHSAFYSNVPSGHYTFRLRAFVGDETKAGGEIAADIRILPPFYKRWWAYVFYVLVVIGIMVAIYRTMYVMARLRSETRMNDDLAEMKIKFFTSISHELRTPLTLIIGGIEEVEKREKLSQLGEHNLSLAYKNSKRMLSLINDLLDFRKIVKGKMVLKVSRVDIVAIMESVIEDFRKMAADRSIELLFTVSHRVILLWVDPERFESIVYNLLSNAFKFTPNGGRIEVGVSLREQEGAAFITVKDTGIGIAKDKLEHLFDRFTPVSSRAVRGDVAGSGIGLSLCKEIVDLHHGSIEVESHPGEGSLFRVRLLTGNTQFGMDQIVFDEGADGGTARPDYMVSDYSAQGMEHLTGVVPPEGAQKILLVDDNAELRTFIYNHLIGTYRLYEAEDGVEALEAVRRDPPDIIITDLMMPRMDGIEFLTHVRNSFETSHIPVIMLTAKHDPYDRIKAMEYGADGYITKPFSIELLMARIDNLLTQRRILFEKFSTQSARNRVVALDPKDVVVTDLDEEFMKGLVGWIEKNIEDSELTIDQMASHFGLGRTTLYNKIKSLTGKSPVELIKEYRITKSKLYLRTGQFTVSEVAYKVGFSDPSYFSRCFKAQFKMSPAEYLKTHNIKS